MKRLLPPIAASMVFLLLSPFLFAQQVPFLYNYSLQPGQFNPAAQGIGGGSIGVTYRQQFMALPTEERPQTLVFNADISSLLKSERIGLGLLLLGDNAHVIRRTQATGFFAYHLMPAQSSFRVSLGVMAGYLGHRFDFSDRRVNDSDDLALFSGAYSKGQFEGGLGLVAQYSPEERTSVFFHLVLPQLFSQNLSFQQNGSTDAASYELLPHITALAGFRKGWSGIAIEPSAVWRESAKKRQKAGTLDLNLMLHLLENDRLSIGGGWRSDEGGLHFNLGVKPVQNLQVTGILSTHSVLGNTGEVGLSYLFVKKGCGKNITAEEAGIDEAYASASDAQSTAFNIATNTWDKLAIANSHIKQAHATSDMEEKDERLGKAGQYIALADEALEKIKVQTAKSAAALSSAEKHLGQAKALNTKPCNAEKMEQLRALDNETAKIAYTLSSQIGQAKTALEQEYPSLDPTVWIKDGQSKKLEKYYSEELKKQAGMPEDIRLASVTDIGTQMQFVYEFPDQAEEYSLNNAAMEKPKNFANYLASVVASMDKKGVQIEAIQVEEAIQYSEQGAKFGIGKIYDGEYGNKVKIEYRINKGASNTTNCENRKAINFFELAALKAYGLKGYLSGQVKLASEKISLEITAPNPDSDYSLLTKVTLVVKK